MLVWSANMQVVSVSNLGEAMKRARVAAGLRQEDAVARAAGGISKPQWSKLENGHEGNYAERTYAAVDRALAWKHGTARALALGGKVEPDVSSTELAEIRAMVDAIQRRLETERSEAARHGEAIARLADGVQQLLDSMPRPSEPGHRPANAEH